MRDGVILLVVCVAIIGGVGYLLLRANGIDPFKTTVVVQPQDEGPAVVEPPPPAPKPVVKRVRVEAPPEPVVARVEAPKAVAPAPVAPPPPRPPFPLISDIKPGLEKSHVTEVFGQPALTATTGDRGHTLDTFVYKQYRGESVTLIHFEDGRVPLAR